MRRLPGGEINRRRRRRVLLRGDHVPREIVVLCRQPIKIRLVSSVSVSLFFVLLLLVSVAFPFRRRRWLWSNHAIPRARAREVLLLNAFASKSVLRLHRQVRWAVHKCTRRGVRGEKEREIFTREKLQKSSVTTTTKKKAPLSLCWTNGRTKKKEEEESIIIGFFSFNKLLFLYPGRGGKRKTKGREVLVLSSRGFEIVGALSETFFSKVPPPPLRNNFH